FPPFSDSSNTFLNRVHGLLLRPEAHPIGKPVEFRFNHRPVSLAVNGYFIVRPRVCAHFKGCHPSSATFDDFSRICHIYLDWWVADCYWLRFDYDFPCFTSLLTPDLRVTPCLVDEVCWVVRI